MKFTISNTTIKLVLMAGMLGAFLIFLAMLASRETHTPLHYFFRDRTATGDVPFYTGFISEIGIIGWVISASVTLFTAWIVKNRQRQFLLAFGGLTLFLLLDDAFLFHEEIWANIIGLSSKYLFGTYGLVMLLFLYLYRKEIFESQYQILLLGLMFFAVSVVADTISDFDLAGSVGMGTKYRETMVEDGSKVFAIAFWTIYFVHTSYRYIQQKIYQKDRKVVAH